MNTRRWLALLFLFVLALGTLRLITTLAEPGSDDGGFADFRDALHAPASALLDGVNPYDVDAYRAYDTDIGQAFPVYSPHHLLLALPFGVLPRIAAGGLWWAVNVAALIMLAAFVVQRVRPEWGTAGVLGLATATLLSNPGRFNFFTGQPTLPLVLGVYVAFTSSNRWLAGAGTALALIKPQLGIPVLLLLVACGRWRTAIDGAALAAAASLPIVIALSVIEGGLGSFVQTIVDNLDNSLSGDEAFSSYRIDLVGVIGRESNTQIGTLGTLLGFVALVVFGTWLLRRWGRIDAVALTVVGLVTLLSLFHLPYDELLLVWPLVALAFGEQVLGRWQWWAVGAMAAAVFNPLTVRFLSVGRGLDTVTSVFLIVAIGAVAFGVVGGRRGTSPTRQPSNGATRPGSR